MDTLKKYLSENNVAYLEKVFATSESINGLLPNPFVSVYFLVAGAIFCNVVVKYVGVSLFLCRNLI